MKVICISGKAGSGKDTFAGFLKEELKSKNKKVLTTHFADLLKYICKNFLEWNGEKDEKGRSLLQYIGTDVVRNKDQNYWVKFIADMLSLSKDIWDYVLISDTRFPNEVDYLKEKGFDVLSVNIVRECYDTPLNSEQTKHSSETAMDNYKFDIIYNNNEDLCALWSKAHNLSDMI